MKKREQYTLDHIPKEHRLKAYKEIESTYLNILNSPHWRNLKRAYKEDFINSNSLYTSINEYNKVKLYLNQTRHKLDGFIEQYPEFAI